MRVKYVRVSTDGQTTERQLLDKENFDKIYVENVSGTVPMDKRLVGMSLMADIKNGKVTELHLEELSRIGRDALDVMKTLKICEEYGVNVVISNLGVQSIVSGKRNEMFNLVTGIVASLAENERKNIAERCLAGRVAARNRGVKFGRKEGWKESKTEFLSKEKPKQVVKYLDKGYTWVEIMKLVGCSKTLIYKVKQLSN